MARITSEEAALAVGNRYDLILIASRRARELRQGWKSELPDPHRSEMVTALREIEQGKVGRDYLQKPLELKPEKKGKRDETRS